MALVKYRSPLRLLAIAAILVVAITGVDQSTHGQERDRLPGRTGPSTGAIRGRVLAADSGARLRRARVRLVSITTRQSLMQMTDANGAFDFPDLVAGQYTLVATKGGFTSTQFGQSRAFASGTPIVLAAGQTLDMMDIYLNPGATIDGRVYDEFGEPLADAVIMTTRSQFAGGRRRLVSAGRALTTNEKGEYHLFGLSPGTYYLSATLINQNATEAASRDGYAPTYYPGTADITLAETITLSTGEQRGGVDLVLNLVRTSTVSGMARDADGHAFGSGSVTVIDVVSGFPVPISSAPIAPDGSFILRNVPPGQFTVQATGGGGSGGAREIASQTVSVAGDVNGLVLAVPKPSAITGHFVREARETGPLPTSLQFRLVPANPADDLTDTGTLVRSSSDGSFTAMVRPGMGLIELAGAPPGWHLSRVLQGENDVTDGGLRLVSERETAGVRVMLTRRTTVLDGNAIDSRRRPILDYAVVVFSKDSGLWGFRSRYVAAARPDQQGRFSVKGLPPGDYLLAAVDYVEQGEFQDPDFLESLRYKATSISLAAEEAKELTLEVTKR